MYTYLLINLFSIIIPFVAGFDKRIKFYSQWKYLFPSIALTLVLFVSWDVLFTEWGVWGFNPRYLTGIELINLPVEEWLFFIAIPYACVFTYDSLNYLVAKDYFGPYARVLSWILAALFIFVAGFNTDRIYTFVTLLLTAGFLILHLLVFKSKYLGRFYFAYLFILIPFFLVNGILTGSFIQEPVVWYDDAQNLGIRLFTIPIEDSIYGMLLILMNITFLEWFRGNSKSMND